MLEDRKIKLSSRAQKDFKSLGNEMKNRIKRSLKELASGKMNMGMKKLKGIHGREDLFRLQVGEYRVIFLPTNDEILVIRIDQRKKVYSFLE
jgi:mRNA interferase RelE/StbE